MYRTAATVPFRFFADSFRRSISQENRWSGAAKEFAFSRTISTAEESATKSMQMQIVDALSAGKRSEASSALSSLARGNYSLRANDFLDIFRYCASSPDPLFAMETWSVMEENQISLDSYSSLLMIRALGEGGYLDEAFQLINFLGESQGIYPLPSIYNCFLGYCAKVKSIDHANQCLDLMDRRMVEKNQVTYVQLLKLAVWQKDLFTVQEMWKECISKYSPNIICLTLRRFICSLARLGDLKSAYEALQKMMVLAIRGSTSIRAREPENVRIRTLNVYKRELVMKLLTASFNDIIAACAYFKNYWPIEVLIAQMQILGLQLTSHQCYGLIKATVSKRGFRSGMEVLKIMERRNLEVSHKILATLSVSCSEALKLDLAEAMLDQIDKCPYANPFNVFFAACDALDQPERALRVVKKMRKIKLPPDIKTYEVLFSLFGNVNAPYERENMLSQVDVARRIKGLEMDMAKYGIQHSHLSMENLLKALGAERMIEELIHYLHVAETIFSRSGTSPGTPIYNVVLQSLVNAKESHIAIEMFKSMKSCGMSLTAATYNIMIDCCTILRCFRSASAILSMMLRDGFYPTAVHFTTLTKVQLENRNFSGALDLLEQAGLEGIQFDVLSFNILLRRASEMGIIDVVEFVVELMHQENIKPDPSTCEYVFRAYVDCGFHSTAMEALQVLIMRMLCKESGGSLPEQEQELWDDLVLAEDEEAESRILQLFENFEEDRAVAFLCLRWSAMLGFSMSSSPDHSPWAKRLSTKYGTWK